MWVCFFKANRVLQVCPFKWDFRVCEVISAELYFFCQFLLSCRLHVVSLAHFGLCYFLLKVRLISSFAFLTFEKEAEKCMGSMLPTLLQGLVICDLCVDLLTPFGKSQLYLWLRKRTEQLKQLQKNRQNQQSLV